jgi:hypothetical protein
VSARDPEGDWDERQEDVDARRRNSYLFGPCRCFGHGEGPGTCPGPANCPMCDQDEEAKDAP